MEPLRAGKSCELILKFTNPTQHQTVVTLLGMNDDDLVSVKEDSSTLEDDLEQKLSMHEVCRF